MKILLISTSSGSRGGGELWLRYLGRGLRDLGHKVGLWCSHHPQMNELADQFSEVGEVIRGEYVNTYHRRLRSFAHLFPSPRASKAKDAWVAWGADAILLNKQNLEDGLDLLQQLDGAAPKVACMIHITQSAKYLGARHAWIRDRAAAWLLRGFRGAIVTAPIDRACELSEFLSGRKVEAINNGVPEPDMDYLSRCGANLRRKYGFDQDELIFLGLGRLEPQKAPLEFVRRAVQISKEDSRARFVWVGDGRMRAEFEAATQASGIREKFLVAGWQSEVQPWLGLADALIHTAIYEGMPFAVLEALSAGLPCFVESGLLDEISPFRASGIIEMDEQSHWLNYVAKRSLLEEARLGAKDLFLREFSITQMCQKYALLFGANQNPRQP
ncbi:MAG: glycosyltransferase family 4 protein [Verrucomicrobiales bacterium]